MRELNLVGLSDDGHHLLARDTATAEEFLVRADGRMYPAITTMTGLTMTGLTMTGSQRDSSATPNPITTDPKTENPKTQPPQEAAMESSLTPREIQARIRRGENTEDVAEAAGVPLDRIEGYAFPVIAEREHVCEKARDTIIRRRHAGGPGEFLGELVDSVIRARGGKPGEAVWDAWRDEDARWTLVIGFGGQTAVFTYDVQGRYVLPADQQARDLVGDIAPPDSTDPDSTYTALADALDDDVADAGAGPAEDQSGSVEPPIDLPEDESGIDSDVATPPGVSSLKAARERRAMEQLSLPDEWAPDWDRSPESDHEPHAGPSDGEPPAVPDNGSSARQPSKRKQERRRVPSWDEIMFGGHE